MAVTGTSGLGPKAALAPPQKLAAGFVAGLFRLPAYRDHSMRAFAQPQPVSVYLHIPFCRSRCAYCDVNTYAGLENLIPSYSAALVKEIRGVGQASAAPFPVESSGRPVPILVHSLFIGGGTPSLLSVGLLEQILCATRDAFRFVSDPEITLEANPGSVDLEYLVGARQAGVSRLSLGVQSAHPSELRLLERVHSFPDVIRAVGDARRAGFTNLNLDLMFGLPYQTLSAFKESLSRTMDLGPDHLALYSLSLEFGTPMQAWVERGLLPEADPDLAAEMYAHADDLLGQAGFVHYEISNWARQRRSEDGGNGSTACRHNLQYWRNLPYLGFGAGAHGYAGSKRYANVRSPKAYIRRIQQGLGFEYPLSPAVVEDRAVPVSSEMRETMMLGLRLVDEGVEEAAFYARFGIELEEAFPEPIERLLKDGLIQRDGGCLRLTKRAQFIANQVFCMFV